MTILDRASNLNNGIKNPPQLFDAVLQEILMLIPQHQITSIPRVQNRLLLTGDTLAMPRSHIHGSPRRFYYRLNLTDDPGPGNANFRSPKQMRYLCIIYYYYVWLRMQYGNLRTNRDCYECISVANSTSSPWMCDLGITDEGVRNVIFTAIKLRISRDKVSNLPKRDVRFILFKWRLEKLGTLNKYI